MGIVAILLGVALTSACDSGADKPDDTDQLALQEDTGAGLDDDVRISEDLIPDDLSEDQGSGDDASSVDALPTEDVAADVAGADSAEEDVGSDEGSGKDVAQEDVLPDETEEDATPADEDVETGDAVLDDVAPGDTEPNPTPFSFVDGVEVQVSPLGDQGIRVNFETTLPAHASVLVEDVQGGDAYWKQGEAGFHSDHSITILGLKPARAYKIAAKAEREDGETITSQPLAHSTGSLPANIPPIAVTVSQPDIKEGSGFSLVGLMGWGPFGGSPELSNLAAIDSEGVVRWHAPLGCTDFHEESSGRLLCSDGLKAIYEIDLFEGVVNDWIAGDLGLDSLHHAVHALPNGNILSLGTELRTIEYPLPGGKSDMCNVVGDVVVEFTPEGSVVQIWKMLDLLDPQYVPDPVGFDEPFWNLLYAGTPGGTKDWSHGNSLQYDAASDTILVSLAKLDYVIRIQRSTGKLVWRFGAFGDFKLADGEWPSHQHAASMDQEGLLRMFDNGIMKNPQASRVVEYYLEPAAGGSGLGNAWQVWEFKDVQPFFSGQLGDAVALSNGNILIADSTRLTNPNLPPFSPENGKFSRVIEVTHTSPPQIAHEMVFPDPAANSPIGYWVTKAKRIVLN